MWSWLQEMTAPGKCLWHPAWDVLTLGAWTSVIFGMSAHLALKMFRTRFRKLEMVMRVAVSCLPLNQKVVRLSCDLAAEVHWMLAGCCQTHKLCWKQWLLCWVTCSSAAVGWGWAAKATEEVLSWSLLCEMAALYFVVRGSLAASGKVLSPSAIQLLCKLKRTMESKYYLHEKTYCITSWYFSAGCVNLLPFFVKEQTSNFYLTSTWCSKALAPSRAGCCTNEGAQLPAMRWEPQLCPRCSCCPWATSIDVDSLCISDSGSRRGILLDTKLLASHQGLCVYAESRSRWQHSCVVGGCLWSLPW